MSRDVQTHSLLQGFGLALEAFNVGGQEVEFLGLTGHQLGAVKFKLQQRFLATIQIGSIFALSLTLKAIRLCGGLQRPTDATQAFRFQ
jgi:hypothetical protein